MRLPRRVPWKSLAELDEVCSWIYSADADDATKQAAVHRLAAWRAATQLPHALESTWMILTVVLDDSAMSMQNSGTSSAVVLRQSYALAIVRLVNGLVDPLQQGVYARPISAIAAQIGLPSWLVEIRHAATHEDLPSLTLLREAASQSLTWLLNNYWIPTISPTSIVDKSPPEIPSLAPLLKDYKTLLKLTTRDASLKTRHKVDSTRLLRNLERWIGEAKVAYGLGMAQLDDDEKERWAIDQLCNELLQKGVLVPVSKKKRVDTSSVALTVPPNVMLWEQLLFHVQTNHSSFGSQLISRMLAHLLASDITEASEIGCISGWILWVVQSWGENEADCAAEDVAYSMLAELSRDEVLDTPLHKRVHRVLDSLTFADAYAKVQCLALLTAASIPANATSTPNEITLEDMEDRVAQLNAKLRGSTKSKSIMLEAPAVPGDIEKVPAPGLRLLGPHDGWRPCPVGLDGLKTRA